MSGSLRMYLPNHERLTQDYLSNHEARRSSFDKLRTSGTQYNGGYVIQRLVQDYVSPLFTKSSSTARCASSIAWFVNAAAPASAFAIVTRPKR